MSSSKSHPPAADLGRLLLWTPLLVGGLVATIFATRAMRVRRTLRRLWSVDRRTVDVEARQQLREALVGLDKPTIAAVLGPPRTTVQSAAAAISLASHPAAAPSHHARLADAWYYAFDPGRQEALVIEFDAGGIARDAQFIDSPAAQPPADVA